MKKILFLLLISLFGCVKQNQSIDYYQMNFLCKGKICCYPHHGHYAVCSTTDINHNPVIVIKLFD